MKGSPFQWNRLSFVIKLTALSVFCSLGCGLLKNAVLGPLPNPCQGMPDLAQPSAPGRTMPWQLPSCVLSVATH